MVKKTKQSRLGFLKKITLGFYRTFNVGRRHTRVSRGLPMHWRAGGHSRLKLKSFAPLVTYIVYCLPFKVLKGQRDDIIRVIQTRAFDEHCFLSTKWPWKGGNARLGGCVNDFFWIMSINQYSLSLPKHFNP